MIYADCTQAGGAIQDGGYCRGVLRNASGKMLWTCEHEHLTHHGAMSCAYQAEGQARAAGLLPERRRVDWTKPETWPPGLRKDRRLPVTE